MKRSKQLPLSLPGAAIPSVELTVGKIYEFRGDLVELRSFQGTDCEIFRVYIGRSLTVPASSLVLLKTTRRTPDFLKVTEEQWKRAKAIAKVLNRMLDEGITSREELNALGKQVGLRYRRLQTLRSRYRHNRLVASCLEYSSGPRKGSVRNVARRDVINEAIDLCVEKKPEATTVAEIVRVANERLEASDSKSRVTKKSVKTQLRKRGIDLRDRRRRGPEKFNESRLILPGENKVAGCLDQVQIDHTQIDLMALDPTRTYSLGRPWLTLVFDVYSTMILGFYISMARPSMVSVARALTIAALPKTDLLFRLGLSNLIWCARGKPRTVLTDNAAEFTTSQFIAACENAMIEAILRPLGRKHWGGHIERAIGTLMGQLHLLPGTTFRNVVEKYKYDPSHRAVMSLDGVIRYVTAQICAFNSTPRKALNNLSAELVWNDCWKQAGGQPNERKVFDPRSFYISFLPTIEPTLRSGGVQWGEKRYYDSALNAHPIGRKIKLRADGWDTRQIYLPTRAGDGFIDIPRRDDALSNNLSFDQFLRAANQKRTETGENGANNVAAQDAMQSIFAFEESATATVRRGAKTAKTGQGNAVSHAKSKSKDLADVGEGIYVPSASRSIVRVLQ